VDHAERMSADNSFIVKVKTDVYINTFTVSAAIPVAGHYWNRLGTLPASLPWSNAVGSLLEF